MHLSCFNVLEVYLRLCSVNLCRASLHLHVRCFATQPVFSKPHFQRFRFNDYEILQCLSEKRLQDAKELLDKIPEWGDSNRRVVSLTSLLSKFSRDGFVDEAWELFKIMPERNVVSYNAMLLAYVQCGRLDAAWTFFEEMPMRNVVSWTSMLCGFANVGRISDAKKLFNEMPERNAVSWNSMIVGLKRNGNLDEAREVFDAMPAADLVSWNTIIAGYAEANRMEEAQVLFDRMQNRNVVTWTSMVVGYCRSGDVEEGYRLFCRIPQKNIISWTAMISGFTWNGFYEKALLLFLQMRNYSFNPNVETVISLAYACAGIGFINLGRQLHAHVITNGQDYSDYDGRLFKSLIYMYSELLQMDSAHYIFMKNLKKCTAESLNHMINSYILIGQLEKAQHMFDLVPVRSMVSWTSLINGYFDDGQVAKACYLFDQMEIRDCVAWTVMISGFVQNELFTEAFYLFSKMRNQGVSPLNSTFATLLGAAGAMAYLDQGRQLHCLLVKTQPIFDLILKNSLLSMYAKCGEICDAYIIFLNMISRDLISWNSMIIGFSHHGLVKEALKVFISMVKSGISPNGVTFVGVLSACAHAGLVKEGWEFFNAMSKIYGVHPGTEHYNCIINLLGRAGKLDEAEAFVLGLPSDHSHEIWGALLSVCALRKSDVEIATRASKRILELDPLNAPAHVSLSNIYAARSQYGEVEKLRKDMGLNGVRKAPGCSWIELKGKVHIFLSGDRAHPQVSDLLLLMLGTFIES